MNGDKLITTCSIALYPVHLLSSSCCLYVIRRLISSLSCLLCLWLQKSNVNLVSMVGGAHKRREVTFLWSLWSDEISTNAEAETWILSMFCSGLAE